MGQKINPNIFRLGVTKTWKTEFFEKKRYELPAYTFKDLEIKEYIERFLESQGLLLHDHKQHYSDSTLNLYISYIVLPEFIVDNKIKSNKLILTTISGHRKIISANSKSNVFVKRSRFKSDCFNGQEQFNLYRIKNYLSSSTYLQFKKFEDHKDFQLDKIFGVLNNFFKVLSLFTNNKFNIIINFSCLNKTTSYLKTRQKKNFILLQKFKATPFLKEGIELIFHVIYNRTCAHLLANFIASQMKKIKRHKFFLTFLKQTLIIMLDSKFSVVRGIKIIVKGRLNGVPRAKHKTISIGDIPVQTIDAKIDYSEKTVHNSNGSYGIKVWIVENNKQ